MGVIITVVLLLIVGNANAQIEYVIRWTGSLMATALLVYMLVGFRCALVLTRRQTESNAQVKPGTLFTSQQSLDSLPNSSSSGFTSRHEELLKLQLKITELEQEFKVKMRTLMAAAPDNAFVKEQAEHERALLGT